ncbi:hypothetical protein PHLGIDRAFT_271257 [Phlebiopsis gigantea 11061_1 CR5-6]|uniref:Uncharacterized protein n=1 Tax=Phlebiopsis gigantea (strain 11061_1 CR5-6) TaxID=745531 RepID=A0A0C3PCP1_PHLG1|nr:hypothetical protein PHLGIDRAFT_271257 [Phlebiopsis gigantea 11061_1 CR5-6]
MPTSPTAEYDVDDLPEEENDTDSQEMWEDIGWDDSFAAQLASAWKDDAPRGDFEAADDADENPFWDDSNQPSASKTLRTAISDPGPSKVQASLSRDSSTEEVPVTLNSSQAYAVFPEYNQEDIAEG